MILPYSVLPPGPSSASFLGFLPRPSSPERKGLIPPLDLTGDSQTTDAHAQTTDARAAAARASPDFSFFYGSEGGVAIWQLALSLSILHIS